MENESGKEAIVVATAATTGAEAAEGWDPYDEYDCRLDADSPKQTQQYIDETMPWRKDALAKRQAELEAATAAVPNQADSEKSRK
jgi:hypothetical protein